MEAEVGKARISFEQEGDLGLRLGDLSLLIDRKQLIKNNLVEMSLISAS